MNSGGWRKQTGRDGITPWLEKDVGWWTLADDYKENALEALASSPRYQRYANKRARARVAEGPDPYNTHEVCIKRPPEPLAENISSSKPPPKDAEAYFTPRRTIKHFTDEYFAFQEARLESRGDLDEDGKSRLFHLHKREIPYSSLDSNTTKYSLDPKGGQRHRLREAEANLRASHPPGRPSASEVARRALELRHAHREALQAVPSSCEAGAKLGEASRRWAFPICRESNRRRYSRLCGQD
ncbi:unnamed protein product [Ascophyllum nodosum]